jgi:hypothetical protein
VTAVTDASLQPRQKEAVTPAKLLGGTEMTAIWKMGASVCALATLGGCAGMAVGPVPVSANPNPDLTHIRMATRHACLGLPPAVAAADAEAARIARNNLVTAYMFAVDRAYNSYERQLLDAVRTSNAGAAIGALGLSTIAGVVGNENLARGLTTASAIVTGTHTTIGRDYLLNQTIGVLQTQMRASRATQRAIILERLRLPYADWTFCTALSDALVYEQAGTLNGALVAVAESAAQANEEGQTRAEQAIPTVAFNRSAQATALRGFVNAGSVALAGQRRNQVIALMRANDLVPAGGDATNRLYKLAYHSDPADDSDRRKLIDLILADPGFPDDLKAALRASINQ